MRNPAAGLAVVGLGASLAAMDLAVNVAFPSITAAFELQTAEIRWLVVCYVLTYASLMLACGRLGDRIGHRRIFRAGLVLSIAAYALCALAPSYGLLLAARVVQGVSTALVLSCAPALATFLFAESRRTRALSAYASVSAIASIIAPLVGGLTIAALGWAGVFWFRVPVAVLATMLLPLLPADEAFTPTRDGSKEELAGSTLLAAGLAITLLSMVLVLSPGGWPLAGIAAVSGVVVLGWFWSHERRALRPFLPRAVARDRGFVLANLVSVSLHLAAFAVPLLTPYYLERIAGQTPLTSGAVLACSPSGVLLGSVLAPALVRRVGARNAALIGAAAVVLSQAALGAGAASPDVAVIMIVLTMHGLGAGLFGVAYADIVVGALPKSERGVAGSLTLLTRTVGVITGAVALMALLGAVEAREIAGGYSADAAFVHGYALVFYLSAAQLALMLPLIRMRLQPR